MFGIKWKLLLAIGLAGAIFIVGVYQMGVNAERKRGEANSLRQKLETVLEDKRNAEAAQISAADKAMTLAAEERRLEEELNDLRADLAKRPEGDRYPATDGDLDLLYGRP
jgi:hypothetical protein